MSFHTSVFKLVDHEKEVYSIGVQETLISSDVDQLSKIIQDCLSLENDQIYLDCTAVTEVDDEGINEIIKSYTALQKVYKYLTVVYLRNSEMEKWIDKTGIDSYITTAILPARS
jgi:anti-anti-sigma regulatory factor